MTSESDNFSIMNYLKIFFRRKELLFIPAFLGLIVGICTGMLMPKQYKSSTVILVEEGKTDNPLFNNLAVSTTVEQRLTTIRESMLGWKSLVELVKRLKLDSNVKNIKQYEDLILGIRKRIAIKLQGANVINLSYVSDDPVKTQAVVKNITDIFIEKNQAIQNQETSDAIKFIERQLRIYKGKIKSAEIAKLQDKLNNLLIDSTEKHPEVIELRHEIADKKAELEKEHLVYTKPEDLAMQDNSPLIQSIQKALNKVGGSGAAEQPTAQSNNSSDLYKLLVMDRLGTVAARDAPVNEKIYNLLLQRLETAKITQRLQSSKEGTRYTVVDPPRIPLAPFKPNKPLLALAGLAGGLILGFGLVFASEFLDKSFIDVQEAKEFFGTPLLGAISRIATVETVRHEKERGRWMYLLTILIGLLMVVVTVAVQGLMK